MVWVALTAPLDQLCQVVGSSHALLLHREHHDGVWQVLSCSSGVPANLQPHEPVRVEDVGRRGVRLRSLLQDEDLSLTGVVKLGFQDSVGEGVVLLADAQQPALERGTSLVADLETWRRQAQQLRHRDLDAAYHVVAEAASSDLDPDRLVDVLLVGARALLESDVAYFSIPVDDEVFAFSRTLGIRTESFRRLRVGRGQGLGGAVRDGGKTMRTLDYQHDPRLGPGLRGATADEGIVSAVAAPVFDQGSLEAVLYVGHRDPHAYTQEDETVLDEYGAAAILALRQGQLEVHRRHVVREEERARLARVLHDTFGRQLTQMAHTTGQMRAAHSMPDVATHLDTLTASLDACMQLVRGQMDDLLDAPAGHVRLGSVAQSILEVPSLTPMRRTVVVRAAGDAQTPADDRLIAADLARTLVRIGQEAVFNAEHHSGGNECRLVLELTHDQLVMSVTDDGVGAPAGATPPEPGHHGLQLIEGAARDAGGVATVGRADGGGTEVSCTFKVTPA